MIKEFVSSRVGRPLPSGNGRPKVGMGAMRQVMRRYYVEQLEEHFPLRLLRQGTYPPGPARPPPSGTSLFGLRAKGYREASDMGSSPHPLRLPRQGIQVFL